MLNHECQRGKLELLALIDACLILGWGFQVEVDYVDNETRQLWSITLPVQEDAQPAEREEAK